MKKRILAATLAAMCLMTACCSSKVTTENITEPSDSTSAATTEAVTESTTEETTVETMREIQTIGLTYEEVVRSLYEMNDPGFVTTMSITDDMIPCPSISDIFDGNANGAFCEVFSNFSFGVFEFKEDSEVLADLSEGNEITIISSINGEEHEDKITVTAVNGQYVLFISEWNSDGSYINTAAPFKEEKAQAVYDAFLALG